MVPLRNTTPGAAQGMVVGCGWILTGSAGGRICTFSETGVRNTGYCATGSFGETPVGILGVVRN